jgi:hypothetical protein
MKPLTLLFLVSCLPLTANAQNSTGLTIAPLKSAGAVPEADRRGYEAALRKTAATVLQVKTSDETAKALKKGNVRPDCATDSCGAAAARATGARFILHATVSNSDEIYQVELSLFDSAFSKRTKVDAECELCAADEVKGTLKTVFSKLGEALAIKAPAVAGAAEENTMRITVESTPSGAQVRLDGEERGVTPLTTSVTAGRHRVEVSKAGYASAVRVVNALNAMSKISVKLEPGAPGAVAGPPISSGSSAGDGTEQPLDSLVAGTRAKRVNRGLGYGLAAGGALLSGLGSWLILIDGEVTCPSRGIRECPHVYNTNTPGLLAMGVGAGLLGAGVTILIQQTVSRKGEVQALAIPTSDGGVVGFGGRF